jgi:hypothetical protein
MNSEDKRKELVLDYFGTFVPGQGTHAEACLQALSDYDKWLDEEGYFGHDYDE